MKKQYNLILLGGLLSIFSSCDSFLDTIPDNRAELNTVEKITALLTSAYPNKTPKMIMQYASDNVLDLGREYSSRLIPEEAYAWKDITGTGNDDPRYIWQTLYSAISNANQALQAIEEYPDPNQLKAQRAEALICRAYSHYVLSTLFCKAYNPETADKDFGLPYASKPETQVLVKYKRGTMNELYANIHKDIEAALPDINDAIYSVPKYHFNQKAAYAFAARFNLFYTQTDKSNYKRAVEYADKALGTSPASLLRDFKQYLPLGAFDISRKYVQANEPANFLIQPIYSISGRSVYRYPYHRDIISNELYWSLGPWGSSDFLYWARKLYGFGEGIRFPKADEFWEEAGYAHIVTVPFTADETLLVRAEAKIMLEQYDEATGDLQLWYHSHCAPEYKDSKGNIRKLPELTRDRINMFFGELAYAPVVSVVDGGKDRTIKKKLHPQGFTVAEGEQENFVHCVLHFRRLETLFEGQRWIDIKRYGIEIGHNRKNEDPDILTVDDPRRAFQLPIDVIEAGIEANPR
ncbi:RagB/SusD family nutrient uptake outer membrane protein [Bacteroides pyogenes]|uniref:RagB/SusD family nutrient uptake outer membrane protein n=1 Tax=Bacteroides pyogenes TaxID=310300 RepID=UPI001BAA5E9E|nr:RagB/SusD family nutrient uptake outer membrane protein [Bacteroides pyogenes]MBR8706464.1 hypothetical protein [Bacteroides pyogenes]